MSLEEGRVAGLVLTGEAVGVPEGGKAISSGVEKAP
jgi:hypothetical protein